MKIGFPITKNPGKQSLSQTIEAFSDCGVSAYQLCMTPSQNGHLGKKLSENEKLSINQLRKEKNLYIVVHGKYIYNFCRKDSQTAIDLLVHELELSNEIGSDVIIHQGKNVPDEQLERLEALDNYVKHVSEALERTYELSNSILLENSARQGTELGYGLDELKYIYSNFDDNLKSRIGFCLDLCHIFVAGELDLRKESDVEQFFDQFDREIGLDKLKCIHFNDSSIPFNECRDRHGDLAFGYITNPLLGGSEKGFQVVAKIARKNGIAIIFETPCMFANNHQHPQRLWQVQIVNAWSINDNQCYLLYQQIHQQLIQVAYDFYVNPPKKQKPRKQKQKQKQKPNNQTSNIKVVPSIELETNVYSSKPKLKSKPKVTLKLNKPCECCNDQITTNNATKPKIKIQLKNKKET
jgi:deoxyribonuclease-4